MPSSNDITGDSLVSRTATQSYRDNWDVIFGKKAAQASTNEPQLPFMIQLALGKVIEDQIDSFVDRWHGGDGGTMCLRDYLGMTPSQYENWVKTGSLK